MKTVSCRVLIVEDEPEIVRVYKIAFPRYGLEIVDVAVDGLEGVEKYKSLCEQIDLVLMDHRLPGISGLEASRLIMEYDPCAIIVFGSADSAVREEALRIGAKKFYKKPFDIKTLAQIVKNAV